jgi:TldD protein
LSVRSEQSRYLSLRPRNHRPAPHTALDRSFDRRRFLSGAIYGGAALAATSTGLSGCGPSGPVPPAPIGGPDTDPLERELALLALDEARTSGARYADLRISHHSFESVQTREQQITGASSTDSHGLGIRALVGGSWGFAGTPDLSRDSVVAAAREATAIAKANDAIAPVETELAPVAVFPEGSWTTPHEIDPFDVSIEEKADLLLRTNAAALTVDGVAFVRSGVLSVKERRLVATSEGTMVQQTFLRLAPNVDITAISPDRSDFQTRGAVVEPAGRGWDYVLESDLPGNAPRWAEEAAMKLDAASVEPGKWDLVLHPSHLWLTIHESIGHPTELDRALGYEANYAGTSFLAPPAEVLGKTRLGPEFMTFMGNRDEPTGCATVGWDDEGVPADAWPIIENGIFVDYQTTREQASWISELTGVERSHGCAFGMNWANIPFQRMPNVSLMPAEEALSDDDVIAQTERGILIEGRGSYSIDQQRYNMQFGGQVFWEIRNGRKHRMLRDVAYVGRTPDFWNSLAVLGGPDTYYIGASFGDGKGQPGQSNAVSHGCPIALFRGVDVINTA